MSFSRVAIASDHGGRLLKAKIIEFLAEANVAVLDHGVGPAESASVDYPDFAQMVSKSIQAGEVEAGILVCGTGIGMSIGANKFEGIRAALVTDEFTSRMSREHNNSNIICLGERVLNHDRALDYLSIWLNTSFEGDRHQRRLDKVSEFESRS